MKQLLPPFLPLLIIILHSPTMSAQIPTQSGPVNITGILEKAGQFTTFIKLLTTTQISNQINTQLNNSNQGLTIFAPPDNAFSDLKPGSLNSLSDQQKTQLIQFHILPSLIPMSQFQTASNPLRTQAGNSNAGEFQLNVTSSGNQVNITTGVVTAMLGNTIYTDSKLAVYQVDHVLLPMNIFGTESPAPEPAKAGNDVPASSGGLSGNSGDSSVDSSGAIGRNYCGNVMGFYVIGVFVAIFQWI